MSVTYGLNDNYTDIYDGKMANCCQKVRGNKTNQRPKQQQNKKIKTKQHKTQKQEGGILSYRFYFTDFLERFI